MGKKLDLVGRTFGYAKVLAPCGIDKKGASLWRCQCLRCGNEFAVAGYRLTASHRPRTDCGCNQRERSRDLTGQTFGGIYVVCREGNTASGDKQYRCRCNACGKERLWPASTIKMNPQSCGCLRYPQERMHEIGKKAAETFIFDGAAVYLHARTEPDCGNQTGYRWVRVLKRKGKEDIFAMFFVKGKRYYKGGFSSKEAAHKWALEEHERVLEELGLADKVNQIRKEKEGKK